RVHLEPQLRGAPGQGRAHPPGVAGDGRGRGDRGALRRHQGGGGVNPVTVISGRMVPLWRADVDTDQIMPKQFLKRVERTGFGEFVFHDWRSEPDFVLNDERYAGANVLVTGPNFGSGSSREHAPWGLQ